jgi:hypothetical protein
MEISAKEGFYSPNFLELVAINLYKDYENNKNDDNDISATLTNRTESIMLDGSMIRKKQKGKITMKKIIFWMRN